MKTRAAILYERGKPPPYTVSKPLIVETVELDGPGYREVLVEVIKAGLCHSDLSVVDGSRPRPVPMVIGHEASGIIREVGEGVTEVAPGDHVIFYFVPSCGRCIFCVTGRPALCIFGNEANIRGSLLDGSRHFRTADGTILHHHLGVSAFSEFTVVAEESVIKVPPEIPFEVAALFGCAILTGVGAVLNTARVEAGAGVAVFGLGGVGLSIIMGAKLAGAFPIIAIDVLERKLELAKKLGATYTVNASISDPVQAVRDIVPGGVPYAFEAVGSEKVLIQAYWATSRGGTTITVGLPHPERQFTIPAVSIVAEERTIKGSYMGSAIPRRDIPRLLNLYKAGLLPVNALISRIIPLREINDGLEALRVGEVARQIIDIKAS